MKRKHKIFLNYAEALRAIRFDLEQYDPQPILLRQLAQLIFSDDMVFSQDKQKSGLWIKLNHRKKFRLVQYDQLPAYLCTFLEDRQPPLEQLAKICGCVFQEHSYPGSQLSGKVQGIFVETGLENFKCRQCGQCCRFLEYHRELTHEDYLLWQRLERNDILERVKVLREKGRIVAYRIWIDPVTHRTADCCPWLTRDSEHNRYICQIYDVRPDICRQYPGSRKHARMTGCRSFSKSSGS